MNKSIFLIDTPKCCGECPMSGTDVCRKWFGKDLSKISETCPLREVPEHKDEENEYTDEDYYRAQGWNDCIDEILG